MSWLNIENEVYEEIGVEEISSYVPIQSGAYIVTIEQCYLRKTDSGAVMLELETELEDKRKLSWSTCVVSGDEKGNKSTYTNKNGKQQALPGVSSTKHLFEAVGMDMKKEEPTVAKIIRGDKTIDAKVFKQLTGKKFIACVQQYENLYNNEVSLKLDILNFLDVNGKNSTGESQVEKFNEKIARTPIKKLKTDTGASVNNVEAAAASGW
jgi:hypothetical protein